MTIQVHKPDSTIVRKIQNYRESHFWWHVPILRHTTTEQDHENILTLLGNHDLCLKIYSYV